MLALKSNMCLVRFFFFKGQTTQNLFTIRLILTFEKAATLTRSSCCSSATAQSPVPSCPPGICCSRWRTFPPSVSWRWTASPARSLMCHLSRNCSGTRAQWKSLWDQTCDQVFHVGWFSAYQKSNRNYNRQRLVWKEINIIIQIYSSMIIFGETKEAAVQTITFVLFVETLESLNQIQISFPQAWYFDCLLKV